MNQGLPEQNSTDESQIESIASAIINLVFWVFLIVISVYAFLPQANSPKVKKSKLAKSYNISVKVLMKWIRLFCPEYVAVHYVGTKKQKLNFNVITYHLGKPEDYPRDKQNRILNNRKAIWRAFKMGDTTLNRRIKELKKPEEKIGMSFELYKSLRSYPPRQSQLLVAYLIEYGERTDGLSEQSLP